MNERIELANCTFVRCFSTKRRGREGVFFFFVFMIVHTWIPWSCGYYPMRKWEVGQNHGCDTLPFGDAICPIVAKYTQGWWRRDPKKNTPRAAATEATCEDINGVPHKALQLIGGRGSVVRRS